MKNVFFCVFHVLGVFVFLGVFWFSWVRMCSEVVQKLKKTLPLLFDPRRSSRQISLRVPFGIFIKVLTGAFSVAKLGVGVVCGVVWKCGISCPSAGVWFCEAPWEEKLSFCGCVGVVSL